MVHFAGPITLIYYDARSTKHSVCQRPTDRVKNISPSCLVSKNFNTSIYNISCQDHSILHTNTLLTLRDIWTCKYNFFIANIGDEITDLKIS
jgi:hypothetical protein